MEGFFLDPQVDEYDIKDVKLDIGFDVSILPNKSWEVRRNPKMVYS